MRTFVLFASAWAFFASGVLATLVSVGLRGRRHRRQNRWEDTVAAVVLGAIVLLCLGIGVVMFKVWYRAEQAAFLAGEVGIEVTCR